MNINFEAIEAMLYFWQALKDKEKVPEIFIYEIAEMPGLKYAYDDEFNEESVRRTLSAIKNREVFTSHTKKEARFWNNNLWMLEDLKYTDEMLKPIKTLNLDDLDDSMEVYFAPLHFDDCILNGKKLIINFFKIKPEGGIGYIDGKDIKTFIKNNNLGIVVK